MINVKQINPDQFKPIAKEAHLVCFKEDRPDDFNRYDYVLVCEAHDKLTGYATILEHDQKSAYMQHGGALTDNQLLTVKSYFLMIDWLKKKYPIICTRIFNYNIPMLNLAMRAGLRICGVEYFKETPNFKSGVLLSLYLEQEEFNAGSSN